MDAATVIEKQTRRPRFRRASYPPPFRLTTDDIEIVRHVARHRFIGSGEIATLVNRSIDRTNDRLMRLYHAGYIDRPRAQLDRFPTGSGRFIYALADRGARLLASELSTAHIEWSRKNREAGRPFIEHQIKIVEFQVAIERAASALGVQFMSADDLLAEAPEAIRSRRNPFALRTRLSDHGTPREISAVPDLAFGLKFADGSRRCFLVEIDRGTMPITRADINQTSFERKMRVYLAAHAAGQHQRQFGWKTFRVLTITTDYNRIASMIEIARRQRVPSSPGPSLFLFATADSCRAGNPLIVKLRDGTGRDISLT